VNAEPAGAGRDEIVVGRDDLDTWPQTQKPPEVSHNRVIQYRFKGVLMSNSITARVAGSRTKFALLLLGGLAGAMGAGAASADGSAGDVPTAVVKYSAQSLTTEDGVNELYHRIVRAAKQVCPEAPIRDLRALHQFNLCRDQAVARAIRKIDNSRLAVLHATNSKNS